MEHQEGIVIIELEPKDCWRRFDVVKDPATGLPVRWWVVTAKRP